MFGEVGEAFGVERCEREVASKVERSASVSLTHCSPAKNSSRWCLPISLRRPAFTDLSWPVRSRSCEQHRGAGRALVAAVIDRATLKGVHHLLLSARPAMTAAQHL